jgi:CheY-like chemotaxis protein
MRVLIVDDFPDTAEIASELLTRQGHECRTASSGSEALAAVEAWSPDLAILDIGLPDLDGYQLAAALCARLAAHPPYLVAMSGWAHGMDRARQAGFGQYLLKPASQQQLLRAVELAQGRVIVVGGDGPRDERAAIRAP